MRNVGKDRSGFEVVLAAVVATFVAVSGASAQSAAPATASELAIDAAVPMPEPANVPPPTAADFAAQARSLAIGAPKIADPVTTASTTPLPPADATRAEPARPTEATEKPAAPAPAPAVAASVAPADQAVSERLREALGARSAKYFDRKNERAAVEAFYAARNYAPLWSEAGAVTPRGKAVIARLRAADKDGLDPADYPAPDFAAASPDALADAELKLTASALDYARQAQSGRVHWSRTAADIAYPEHPTDPADVMAKLAGAADASAALESYNPPQKGYVALRKKLAELRGEAEAPLEKVEDGPVLTFKPARKKQAAVTVDDPRVPLLRSRLGISENADSAAYDARVADAVRKFQANAGLKATGALDAPTVRAINSPKRDRQIDTVILNMERWRWLPRELGEPRLGDAYVMLNVPDFTLKVMHRGAQVWTTRVVTGKPGKHATPMMTETMKFITVNPTWNVPPSIIYNEYLPALQQDPTVLSRMGLKLETARDGSVRISQPPGERNALGRIRFNFPNKFLVYQHDTPDKHLFARDERAFSHGCMRVQNPDQYAETLLGIVLPKENYSAARIRSLYGTSEHDIRFPTPIPVHITYQTAFVDEAGQLQIRKDVYGRDQQLASALRGKGANLEMAVAHPQPNYTRPKMPGREAYAGNDGPNFFERLFGGSSQPEQPVRPQRRVYTR